MTIYVYYWYYYFKMESESDKVNKVFRSRAEELLFLSKQKKPRLKSPPLNHIPLDLNSK